MTDGPIETLSCVKSNIIEDSALIVFHVLRSQSGGRYAAGKKGALPES
jgi:hypothetical protein